MTQEQGLVDLLCFIGFLLGVSTPWLLSWLVFVYPYGEVSIKSTVAWYCVGFVCGGIALIIVLLWFSQVWPGD